MSSCCDGVLAADQPPLPLLGLVSDRLDSGLVEASAPYPSFGRITGFGGVPMFPYLAFIVGVVVGGGGDKDGDDDDVDVSFALGAVDPWMSSNFSFLEFFNMLGMADGREVKGLIVGALLAFGCNVGDEPLPSSSSSLSFFRFEAK
jgi:hypothetical protein